MSELLSVRPNLEVTDVAPTVTPLCEVFGFAVEVDEPEMGLALLHRDLVGVAVVRAAEPAINETTQCYIGVRDIDNLYATSVARGATVVIGLTDHAWGLRDFVVQLPAGHRLAFGERTVAPEATP
jgi:predicted enzyme related to lactoylglutathione lyase